MRLLGGVDRAGELAGRAGVLGQINALKADLKDAVEAAKGDTAAAKLAHKEKMAKLEANARETLEQTRRAMTEDKAASMAQLRADLEAAAQAHVASSLEQQKLAMEAAFAESTHEARARHVEEKLAALAAAAENAKAAMDCLLYTSPSPRDLSTSRMPSSA